MSEHLYLAVNNTVCAINKASGDTVWTVKLKSGLLGSGFVSLAEDEERLFAHSQGWLHCISKKNGSQLWVNELPGLGYDLAMLTAGALTVSTGHQTPMIAEVSTSSGSTGGNGNGG